MSYHILLSVGIGKALELPNLSADAIFRPNQFGLTNAHVDPQVFSQGSSP